MLTNSMAIRLGRGGAGLALVFMLAACASYAPRPLPDRFSAPTAAGQVQVDAMRLPPWAVHVWNPADGLDSDELAMLAVANNPQLRATRAALGIAHAQVFAAGLLADPQIGYSEDLAMTPGTQNAWALGLGFDISDWLMRSSRKRIAQAGANQAEQELLWQEWQVVNAARLSYVRMRADERLLPLLQQLRDSLRRRYEASRRAGDAGNLTADAVAADWLTWQGAQGQLDDAYRFERQDRAVMNDLTGLDAAARVRLSGDFVAPRLDVAGLVRQFDARLRERPDMAALRAGYDAQEAGYRAAVLAQFPVLGVSINRSQDNYGDNSAGPGVVLSLPVFNRNRGNIAVARASRRQLYEEYRARWLAAQSEFHVVLDILPRLEAQVAEVRRGMPALEAQAHMAERAEHEGNLAAPDAARMRLAWIAKRIELIHLEQSLAEQRIALQTLLGPALPEHPIP